MICPLFPWMLLSAGVLALTDSSIAAVSIEQPGPSSRRTALAISEIMYHPTSREDGLDGEFVEIYNSQPWDEDISGFRLDGAIRYTFPESTAIGAHGFIVVARSPDALRKINDHAGLVSGPYDGQLSNASEVVRLLNRSGAVLLEVPYEDTDPWPVAADGLGHSIVLSRASLGEGDPRAWSASDRIGGSPGEAEKWTESPLRAVVLNEVYGNATEPEQGFIELLNTGTDPVDLANASLTIAASDSLFQFPVGTLIQPKSYMVIAESDFPVEWDLGGRELLVGLVDPESSRVLVAAKVRGNADGLSFGRSPDGSNVWSLLSEKTPNAANASPWLSPIIFNEIMFHPISGHDGDEYVELLNRTESPTDVSGWQITGGIRFTIPRGRVIPAGGYLVVAKDGDRLRSAYRQLDSTNTIGNYSGKLSNSGEMLELMRPANVTVGGESSLILVDSVRYRDRSRTLRWADGGGSSLELRDPESDNGFSANWADSDESAKADWTTIEATSEVEAVAGVSASSLQVLLLGAGEMLVDDVVAVQDDGVNRVRNATFETDSNWVFQGNHERSDIVQADDGNRSLHIRASGRGDPHSNRIRQTLQGALKTSRDATLRARVRWLRGHPEILLRTLGNHIETFGRAGIPANLGSPGQQNSAWVANAAPSIHSVQHSPVFPAAGQPITVTVQVQDYNGIGTVRLIHRNDSTETDPTSVTMVGDGAGNFSALIDGAATGQLIAFVVEAEDTAESPAMSRFPDERGECLVRFGEAPPRTGFGDYRMWFTETTRRAWSASSRARSSNEPLSVTFVSNGERVIHGAGAMFSGSFFNSPDYDTPTGNPCDYVCTFPGNDRFLGASRIILSWPGLTGTPDRTAQHEQFSYWLASQIGLPFNHRRYVGVSVNGVDRGVMEDTQRPNNDMLQQWFPSQKIDQLTKIQVRYEGNDRSNDFDEFQPATLGVSIDDEGNKRIASYRWNWANQSDGATANDFSALFELVDAVNENDDDSYARKVRAQIDFEQWMRTFALEHAVGNWDSYGYGNGQNMYMARPADGKWQLMIWDMDIGSGSSIGDSATTNLFQLSNSLFPQVNGDRKIIGRMYDHPEFVRAYWRALADLANGPMTNARVSAIVDPKFEKLRQAFGNAIRSPSAIKTFMRDRRTFILDALGDEVSATFAIKGLNDGRLTASTNPTTIRGTAPISVRSFNINGVFYPVEWSTPTEWELTHPLFDPTTALQLDAIDQNGQVIADISSAITIDFTGQLNTEQPNIIINEWMAVNDQTLVDPADADFDDWVELYNAGTTTVDLSGFTLTDDLEQPASWSLPDGTTLAPAGYLVIWLDSEPEQTSLAAGLHASFSLSGSGDEIGLYTPNGMRMDAVSFGIQIPDVSMGRFPAGSRDWPVFFSHATPGASNVSLAISPFRILDVKLADSGDSLQLMWESQPGLRYVIQSSASLSADDWQNVGEPVTAGETAASLTVEVPIGGSGTHYFRIATVSE